MQFPQLFLINVQLPDVPVSPWFFPKCLSFLLCSPVCQVPCLASVRIYYPYLSVSASPCSHVCLPFLSPPGQTFQLFHFCPLSHNFRSWLIYTWISNLRGFWFIHYSVCIGNKRERYIERNNLHIFYPFIIYNKLREYRWSGSGIKGNTYCSPDKTYSTDCISVNHRIHRKNWFLYVDFL